MNSRPEMITITISDVFERLKKENPIAICLWGDWTVSSLFAFGFDFDGHKSPVQFVFAYNEPISVLLADKLLHGYKDRASWVDVNEVIKRMGLDPPRLDEIHKLAEGALQRDW